MGGWIGIGRTDRCKSLSQKCVIRRVSRLVRNAKIACQTRFHLCHGDSQASYLCYSSYPSVLGCFHLAALAGLRAMMLLLATMAPRRATVLSINRHPQINVTPRHFSPGSLAVTFTRHTHYFTFATSQLPHRTRTRTRSKSAKCQTASAVASSSYARSNYRHGQKHRPEAQKLRRSARITRLPALF